MILVDLEIRDELVKFMSTVPIVLRNIDEELDDMTERINCTKNHLIEFIRRQERIHAEIKAEVLAMEVEIKSLKSNQKDIRDYLKDILVYVIAIAGAVGITNIFPL